MSVFEEIRERDARREAWEELGRQSEQLQRAAAEQAERDSADAAHRAMVTRRTELEFEFAAEVEDLAAEHGGAETTHDVARAEANIATRWGSEYDRASVAQTLERDPEPTGDDYGPIRPSRP